jgi:hypothetical protein
MKKKLKGLYLLVSSIFIYILHVPFAFAKSATGKMFADPGNSLKKNSTSAEYVPPVKSVYDSLHLNLSGLSKQAYDYAKKGFDKLLAQGKLLNDSILTIVDFSQTSNKKRLYVVDMKNYKVLFNTLVAHGKNSGVEYANSFSNQSSSYKSSPGFYTTGMTYQGNNGYSLKLQGLESGINDNAYERTIVMHGADYVNQSVANSRGWIGRSWGCPAVPVEDAPKIINRVKNGSCLFIFSPDVNYISRSSYLS